MELTILRQTFLSGICLLAIFTVLSNGQNSYFVCEALRPVDFVTAPQPSDSSPYMVLTSTTEYIIGNDLSVLVTINMERSFTELFLAARDVATRGFVGMWNFQAGDSQRSTIDCFDGPTVFNYTPSLPQRTNFQASWTLPSQSFRPTQGMEFQATIVDSSGLFWSPVTSQTVNVLSNNIGLSPTLQCMDEVFQDTRFFQPPECTGPVSPTDVIVACNVTTGTAIITTTTISCTCTYQGSGVDNCLFTLTNPCQPSPCVNGDCFRLDSTGFFCLCSAGYTGQICDTLAAPNNPPELNCVNVNTQVNLFQPPSCSDIETSTNDLNVDCNFQENEVLSVGVNVVTCMCTDESGTTDSCSYTITVEAVPNNPPVLNCMDVNTQVNSFQLPPCSDVETSPTDLNVACNFQENEALLVGVHAVMCTCTDESGAMDSCSYTITVQVVNTPPVIQCIDISLKTTSGNPGSLVPFSPPTCSDLEQSSETLQLSCNPMSNNFFPVGDTTVFCTCTDNAGAIDTCTFTLSVFVNTPPSITCPGLVMAVPISANVGNVVNFDDGGCFDAEDGSLPTSCSPASGSFFGIGPTTVTCTCTDSCDETVQCSFLVTVNVVNTPPVIQCIIDSTRFKVASGNPGSLVPFSPPTCFDSEQPSQTLQLACNPMSNNFFPVGDTTVSCTCTDNAGAIDTCSFTLTVFVNTPPSITCPGPVIVESISATVGNSVNFDNGVCFDAEDGPVPTSCSPASSSFFGIGSTTVTCTCTDSCGEIDQCNFLVTVNVVNTPPVIQCISDFSFRVASGNSGSLVPFSPPTCFHSEQSSETLQLACNPMSNNFFPVGDTTVFCTCTDNAGAIDTCSFTLTVFGTAPCPKRAVVEMSSGVFTSVQLPEPLASAQTTFIDANGNPVSQDNFTVGITKAVRRNDESLCLQNIIIVDASPPEVTLCSEAIIRELKRGEKNISVDWREPSATDIEGGPVTVVSTHKPGDLFTKGVTTVVYTFCDSSNNLANCTFTVIVTESEENEPTIDDVPVIKDCFNNSQIVEVEEGQREYNVTLQLPPITDRTSSSPAKEDNFTVMLGLNELQYNYTDADENRQTCLLQILVATTNTTQKRAVFDDCPRTITVNTTSITNFSEVFWTEPVVRSPAMVKRSPLPDTFFEEITVTYTAEVNGIVKDKCSFTVIITDVTPPVVFNCPTDINATSCRGARTVLWFEPYAVDNSNKPVSVFQTHEPLKTLFKMGTTRVTYNFEDDSENLAVCHFNVNIRKSQNCRPFSPSRLLIIFLISIVVVIVLLLICAVCLSCGKDAKDDNTQDDQEVEEMELS